MKTNLYVIFDNCSKIYNKPFSMINDQVATRSAQQLMADNDSDIARNPEDFTMFCIGTYDDTTAIYKPHHNLQTVVRFHQLPAIEPLVQPIPPIQKTPGE